MDHILQHSPEEIFNIGASIGWFVGMGTAVAVDVVLYLVRKYIHIG